MPRKLARTRIALEPGYVYLIDADGDLARVRPRARGDARPRKLLRLALVRDAGFLYYVDRDGDVSRVPLARADPPSSCPNSRSSNSDSSSTKLEGAGERQAKRGKTRGAKRIRRAAARSRGV